MRALVDSSLLIAAAHPTETHCELSRAALQDHARDGLGVPITILAETMSFIGTRFGLDSQRRFWDAFSESGIEVVPVDAETIHMARGIDRRYADARYGFADSTLLACCERHRITRVLTLDARLRAYRPTFVTSLEVIP